MRLDALIEHRLPWPGGMPLLAVGAWFKNTVCAARGGEALVSHTVGDLDCVDACIGHEQAVRTLLEWLDATPAAIVHDLHPDFHSTRFARRLADELGVPALGVQHHHAHTAALCAEHGVEGPVRASGRKWPTRSQCAPSTRSSSPPQAVPSLPKPTPSSARPSTGPSTPCSAHRAAVWA